MGEGNEGLVPLNAPVDPKKIRVRAGPANVKLEYFRHSDIKVALNESFGSSKWGRMVQDCHIETWQENGKWNAFAWALVCLTLPNGVCHTDVGTGEPQGAMKSKGAAMDQALKGAVSDGLKRAASPLGPRFGSLFYVPEEERGEFIDNKLVEERVEQAIETEDDPSKEALSRAGVPDEIAKALVSLKPGEGCKKAGSYWHTKALEANGKGGQSAALRIWESVGYKPGDSNPPTPQQVRRFALQVAGLH